MYSNREKKPKSRLFFGCSLVVLILLGIGAYLGKEFYDNSIDNPHSGTSGQVIVEIPLGSTIRDISEILEDKGLIENKWIFEAYIRINGMQEDFLAGKYQASGGSSIPEIIENLKNPIKDEVQVTIPEGQRLTQVADRLDRVLSISPNWSKEDFLLYVNEPGNQFDKFSILESKPADKTLEGFLFPDTYTFQIEASTVQVLEKLLTNSQNKISGKLLSDIEASEFTAYEVLNFAAMIERETIEAKDRKLVGDILYRRYKEGWTLGIDATLLYEHDDWKYKLTQVDLDTPTPYNTRRLKGLPPTPICNPGLESIEGFVYREPNDYYYYISDPQGKMYYASTWAGHQKNIQDHLR